MSYLPYPKKYHQKKVLDHMNFQYQEKLEDWVNSVLEPEQVLNVSVATHGPDNLWTVWYWKLEYKDIKESNTHIE